MARAHSADVPSYDTYPAPTPAESESMPQDWPYEPTSDEARLRAENPRLNQTAEQIGETLGRVTAMARMARGRVRERVEDIRGDASGAGATVQEKFEAMGEQARQRIEDWREVTNERIHDLRSRANDMRSRAERELAEGRERAIRRVNEARYQAQRYAHEKPLHVIGGALAAGIILGIGLRVWRDHD